MDHYKYLPPKFSRALKDLIDSLGLKPDLSQMESMKITGDVHTFSQGRTS